MTIPRLSEPQYTDRRQLLVNDSPTILFGGQVHNSTSSSEAHFRAAVERISSLGMDTVLAPVSWELFEPMEGRLDVTQVDQVLGVAREYGLKVVPLWFGAFKNATSTYAPSWVRADQVRFPRAGLGDEVLRRSPFETEPRATLSVFSPELRRADAAAFAALMSHIAEVDTDNSVVMVQVENEIGLVGASRDHSAGGEEAWVSPVPSELTAYLTEHGAHLGPDLAELWERQGRRTSGTWAEVFGDDWRAAEVFMAWHFASYGEGVAAAGKAVHPLPMYVNAWLGPQPGQDRAGEYPSGGPTAHVLDVWKAGAPSIDLLAPDIYVDEAAPVMATYERPDNPLFVPETRFNTGNLLQALGRHGAIGFSVFGAEDGRVGNQFSTACDLLAPMAHVIADAQAEGQIAAVVLDPGEAVERLQLGDFTIEARDARFVLRRALLDAGVPAPPEAVEPEPETEGSAIMAANADPRPQGLLILEAPDQVVVVGTGLNLTFMLASGSVEIDRLEEGSYVAGRWTRGRVLNGDERLQIVPLDEFGASRITLLRHTGVPEMEPPS